MAAQASVLHLDVEETHQAAPTQDAGQLRLRMTWFFQGMGLAALMLLGVAAVGGFPSGSEKSSGHDTAFAFVPAVGGKTRNIPQVTSPAVRGMQVPRGRAAMQAASAPLAGASAQSVMANPWDFRAITPDGRLSQRVEGETRKTWKFNDFSKDRVQIALVSEGRPIHSEMQLWIGPDWTPFSLKAYSEDGKVRPIHTIIGTRNKVATIETRNIGQMEFPFNAAANYAVGPLATLPLDIPASMPGAESVDGGAVRSTVLDPGTERIDVVLNTQGKQLNARIEILNGPNNPKQTFEVFTNNGLLNSLVVSFNTIGSGNTLRVVNQAPVEFPLHYYTVAEGMYED